MILMPQPPKVLGLKSCIHLALIPPAFSTVIFLAQVFVHKMSTLELYSPYSTRLFFVNHSLHANTLYIYNCLAFWEKGYLLAPHSE